MISMGGLLHLEKLHSHRKENECLTVRCIQGVLYLECYANSDEQSENDTSS